MQHVFWLLPGVLAGRSGPTRDRWELSELREAGIGAVLSVNDGALCHEEDFAAADLRYQCVPLSCNAPPESGDLQHCVMALPKAIAFVDVNASKGLSTLVHCHSGKDRTALFMAYYLMHRLAMPPSVAIARVKAARPIAFTAPGWSQFAHSVLSS